MNYDVILNPEDENTSHALVTRLVGSGKRVLDVGCATGYLAETLRASGNRVWGVEFDGQAAKKAAEHLEGVVVGDVESQDLVGEFGKGSFDVIVFADVLEHLKDPAGLLKRSRDLLADGGYVVMSIPNVAHAAVRLSLLKGRFDYQPLGLLDDTHLRFFTRRTLNEMIDQAGFVKTSELRTTAPPFETEIPVFPGEFPPEVIEALSAEPDSDTYQFVISAVPADATGVPSHTDELQELRSALGTIASALAKIDRKPVLGVVGASTDTTQPLADIRMAVLLSELRRRLPGFDLRVYRLSDSPIPTGLGDEPSYPLLPWTEDSLRLLGTTTGVVLVLDSPGSSDPVAEKAIRQVEQSDVAVVRWSQSPPVMDVLAFAGRMPETGMLGRRRAQLGALGVVANDGMLLLTHLEDPSQEKRSDEIVQSRPDLSAMDRCTLGESLNAFDALTLVACADFVLTDSLALASLAAGLSRPVGFVGSCPATLRSGLTSLGVAFYSEDMPDSPSHGRVDLSFFAQIDGELDRLSDSLVSAFAVPLERDTLRRAEAIATRIASLETANLALRHRLVHDRHAMTATNEAVTPQAEWMRQLERQRELSDEVKSLKEEIERIYSTRTMRAMRPLRKVYRLARFRRG